MAAKHPGIKAYYPKAIVTAPPEQRKHLLRRFWLPAVLFLALAAGGLTGIIAAYELNVSCPNTVAGGIQFGSDPRSLDDVVSITKRISRRPLIVKLSPNVTSIAQMAYVAQEAGADGLSLVNTFVAMAIDSETRKPRIANVTAGLSGPAIKPIALRMVYDASKAVNIPVIGMGGISTAADIVEFMLAGATAVQIGTASYWDPVATEKIAGELETWCSERHVARVSDLTGAMVME